ncbi:MAG: AAA family ATPase, partial [Candidatus Phytoplasma pyri]
MFKKPLSKTQIIYYIIGSMSVLLFILFFCFYQNQNLDLQKQQLKIQHDNQNFQQKMQKKQLELQKEQLKMQKEQQLLEIKKINAFKEEDSNFTPSNTEKFPFFRDLIGFSEEKEALDGFIHYIKEPTNYKGIGQFEPPLGILLYGIAGTGKTTLARAVAQETKLPFFEVASSVFSQKYVGTAPEMVRNLFENARKEAEKNRGAIIFLDECDTIFTNLENLVEGKDIANIVNQFKTELTSMLNNPDKPIFVIGATNHYQKMDEAIKSRFTYHIEIKAGNQDDRK